MLIAHCPNYLPRLQMVMELMNYLLRQRIIFVQGYISDKTATQIVGSLLALEAMDEEEEIRMYINSPGEESVTSLPCCLLLQQFTCCAACLGNIAA